MITLPELVRHCIGSYISSCRACDVAVDMHASRAHADQLMMVAHYENERVVSIPALKVIK